MKEGGHGATTLAKKAPTDSSVGLLVMHLKSSSDLDLLKLCLVMAGS